MLNITKMTMLGKLKDEGTNR